MMPWRVGPTLAFSVVVAAAAMPVRPHSSEVLDVGWAPIEDTYNGEAMRSRATKAWIVVEVPHTAVDVGLVGCDLLPTILPSGSRTALKLESSLPCTLRPGVYKGALSALGRDVEVTRNGAYIVLDVPTWTPGGIGVRYDPEDQPRITELMPGGPAERAGLMPGDRILEVDGHGIDGSEPEQLGRYAIGPVGEPVRLIVARGDNVFPLSIEREVIPEWTRGR